jgi:hypothetical protein
VRGRVGGDRAQAWRAGHALDREALIAAMVEAFEGDPIISARDDRRPRGSSARSRTRSRRPSRSRRSSASRRSTFAADPCGFRAVVTRPARATTLLVLGCASVGDLAERASRASMGEVLSSTCGARASTRPVRVRARSDRIARLRRTASAKTRSCRGRRPDEHSTDRGTRADRRSGASITATARRSG